MPINTKCPGCQSQFQLQDQLAGQQVQCQNCQTVFVAPSESAPAPVVQPTPPVKQESVASAFDQVPAAPQQDTFGSVYDQVSGQQPSGYGQPAPPPPQAPYPNYQHEKKSGSGKGLIIGGGIGCGFLLLCAVGIGAWFILGTNSQSDDVAGFDPASSEFVKEMNSATDAHLKGMIEEHGENKVATILVTMTGGENSRGGGTSFLSKKIRESMGNKGSVVCTKKGVNLYQIFVAPVDNVRTLSRNMGWATIDSVDRSENQIVAKTTYQSESANSSVASHSGRNEQSSNRMDPALLAKQAEERRKTELARIKKEQEDDRKRQEERVKREREKVMRDQQRLVDEANRLADREHRPRDGESTTEWVNRFFESKIFLKNKLESLSKMEVDETQRDLISSALAENFAELTSPFDRQAAAEAMAVWRTEASDRAIISMINGQENGIHVKDLLPAVAKFKTEEAADCIARFIPDFFAGEIATGLMIEMGEVAEDAVLQGKMHEEPKIRTRVYRILSEIGTRTSYEALRENRRLEKDQRLKQQVRSAMDAIEARHPE